MKTIHAFCLNATLIVSLLIQSSCSKDSKNAAEQANEKKIDNQSGVISDDAKEDAKKVAESMVDLASMSMTEFELSKVAAQKATNPQVKTYARQAMTNHQQDERELRNLATQLALALPSTLSKDGKDRLEDMQKETGTAFDIQYLKEMTRVNEEAIDVAQDLEGDAPNDAVKRLATKIINDDKSHRDQAKQLRNALE